MNRRQFTKLVGVTGLSLASGGFLPGLEKVLTDGNKKKYKKWVWIDTDTQLPEDGWKKSFAAMRSAGIDAILPMVYDSRRAYFASSHLPVAKPWLESIIPLAHQVGLEVHAWIETMPCNIDSIIGDHPEWFVVNRLGQSCIVKPAYVSYYKFLCPSRPPVWEFIKKTVLELSDIDGLDGVHLDYIRYPDVVLPIGLQSIYHIVQNKEYPQYDYCYCDVCRHDFKAASGIDPMKLENPASNKAWNKFRYERITHIVNDIVLPVVHKKKKLLTAAVFPNWKDVRQQWSHWKLDGAMPMLYAKYYDRGVDWIGENVKREAESQLYHAPIYSGLAVGQLSPIDFGDAISVSLDSGASGVSLFNYQSMTDEKWKAFESSFSKRE